MTSDNRASHSVARGALAGLSLAILLASLGTSIANVALPTLAQAFDASFQETQWVVLAYLLASTTVIVSVGRLGDLTGRRRLLIAGIALFTIASALCGVAPTLWTLIAARAAQGFGAAIMLALAMALVSETVPKARTGSAMGLLGTMSAIGTFLGPSLGGLLIAALGWRAIFLVTVPVGAVAGVLVYRHLPADRRVPKTGRAAFDNRGTLLLAADPRVLHAGDDGRPRTLRPAQHRAADGRRHRGRPVRARPDQDALAADPARDVPLPSSQRRPRHEHARLHRHDDHARRRPVLSHRRARPRRRVRRTGHVDRAAGRRVDRRPGGPYRRPLRRTRTTIIGLTGIAAGSLALAAIPTTLGIAGYIAPIVVITAGYAIFQTANTTNVMTDVRPDQRGITSGMLNLSRNLGLITGASVMGAVFSLAAGTSDITTAPPDSVATAMRITFLVATALILAALAIAGAPLLGERKRVVARFP